MYKGKNIIIWRLTYHVSQFFPDIVTEPTSRAIKRIQSYFNPYKTKHFVDLGNLMRSVHGLLIWRGLYWVVDFTDRSHPMQWVFSILFGPYWNTQYDQTFDKKKIKPREMSKLLESIDYTKQSLLRKLPVNCSVFTRYVLKKLTL